MGVDPERVVVDPERAIDAGAIALFQPGARSWRLRMIETLSRAMRFSLKTPWRELPQKARDTILYGSGEKELTFEFRGKKSAYQWEGAYEGLTAIAPMIRIELSVITPRPAITPATIISST